ncbi:MAG: ribonuclease Y [Candidatus Alcyoniella australis]|nr:ribonuclease Y [Candidatus Alcyoniella australis]
MSPLSTILIAVSAGVLGVLAGAIVGYLLYRNYTRSKKQDAETFYNKMVEEARQNSQNLEKEAELRIKEQQIAAKADFERDTRDRRQDLGVLEKRLMQKEENLEKKVGLLDQKEIDTNQRERSVVVREKSAQAQEKKFGELVEQCNVKLEKLAGMSREEAKRKVVADIESEAKHEAAKRIKQIEDEAMETAEKKAKNIIALAIQRYAGDYVAERTVSVVALPNDDMKGRIIGREGRNIRALEAATGVDFIVDDTPEAVILSAHNPIRREIARISLERLISDGRIHPGRIEEIVSKAGLEVEKEVQQAGEQATFDLGVHGIHPELIKLLGKLKFRTSYAQNVLQHSLEVAFLAGIMAAELGQNVKQAKRAGLLHDIGKAVDHEVEGTHAQLGCDLARKYGESPKIVHAIEAHHEDIKPDTVLAVLVQAADALSGARPGARREMLETYVKRLADLERIAKKFDGVDKIYAIQAGREIRIIVCDKDVSDDDTVVMSRDIARRIEEEMTYPGQIKVTVIRETRSVEYAR